MLEKQQKKQRRHKRIRAKIIGTNDCPRLLVFRSNQHIYVQLINDQKGQTLVSLSDLKIKTAKGRNKTEIAAEIGKQVAKMALEKKIKKIVFDRAGYKYHGRVKAVAEAARQAGLKF